MRARLGMSSTLDALLTVYLSLHAVLALLIDAQSVLPDLAPSVFAAYQRAGLTKPVAQWVADEGDFLVGSNPLWWRWIIGGEIVFQVPVCIALAFGFAKRRQWVRLPSLLYGTHVLTTMVTLALALALALALGLALALTLALALA